jgi:hypothetical protein
MILNKFGNRSFSALKVFSLQLLTVSLFSCNKSANINANKAYLSLTHVAYGVGPLNIVIDPANNIIPLFSVPDSFGLVTGIPGNPYDTTTARVNDMRLVLAKDTSKLLEGNSAFQQQTHYSIFAFDSSVQQQPISLIIFQDNLPIRVDTMVNIRYLNFSPGPIGWGLKLINTRNDIPYNADTVLIGSSNIGFFNTGVSYFVGYNLSPTAYGYYQVRIGNYQVFAFKDSSNPHVTQGPPSIVDSSNFVSLGMLNIDSTINYNIYLQGFIDTTSGVNRFQLKSVRLN